MLANQLRGIVERSQRRRADIAREIGVSVGCLDHWLSGRRKPAYERLVTLLKACGATDDERLALTRGQDTGGVA